jgi:hypothetical protein
VGILQNFLNSGQEYKGKITAPFYFFAVISLLLLTSSCGYVIEGSNPMLPNNAKTLAVPPIQNQTFQAGLETDLAEQFKSLLHSNSSVKILPTGQADLKLSITLTKLQTASSGLSKDQISTGLKASLKGQAILEDRRTGNKVWEEKSIEVKLTESGENQIINVSSLTLPGNLRELIERFAKKLYDRIFTNF